MRALAAFAIAASLVGTLMMVTDRPATAAEYLESCATERDARVGISNPFATAAAIADRFESAYAVFLATGLDFADAMSAGPSAAFNSAPILLTSGSSIPAVTNDALDRLNPSRIILLGGAAAISTGVEDELRTRFPEVIRLAGADRYATAAAISNWQFRDPEQVDIVYVAWGATYLDALVAGPRARLEGASILLVTKDSIPAATAAELIRIGPSRIVVVGDDGVIAERVVSNLAAFAPEVERLGEPNRYSTALDQIDGVTAAAISHHIRAMCDLSTPPSPPPPADAELDCPAGWVALTYDDGPRPERTDAVVAALDRAGVRGTFFVVGDRVAASPETLENVHDHGHTIANHTWSHENLRGLDGSEIALSATGTDEQIRSMGIPAIRLVRPPFGSTDTRVKRALAESGFTQILWNTNPRDWAGTSISGIHDTVVNRARDGSVIVLHDGTDTFENAAAATERIVATLQARGFCFGVLDASGKIVP